jgi:hypothetical protein
VADFDDVAGVQRLAADAAAADGDAAGAARVLDEVAPLQQVQPGVGPRDARVVHADRRLVPAADDVRHVGQDVDRAGLAVHHHRDLRRLDLLGRRGRRRGGGGGFQRIDAQRIVADADFVAG